MIRKQVYLAPAQNEKIRRLARRQRCTEAEVIREAIESIVDPEGEAIEKLRAAGLIVDTSDIELPPDAELDEFEAEMEAWHHARRQPIGLSQAILDERNE